MTEEEFIRGAEQAGFSHDMAVFMLNRIALKPHSHTADEILDFDQSVTDIIEDTGEETEEDEDEDSHKGTWGRI